MCLVSSLKAPAMDSDMLVWLLQTLKNMQQLVGKPGPLNESVYIYIYIAGIYIYLYVAQFRFNLPPSR